MDKLSQAYTYYASLLDKMKQKEIQKCPDLAKKKIIFHRDNA